MFVDRDNMRKTFLLLVVSTFIGFSAKAQFWKKKAPIHLPVAMALANTNTLPVVTDQLLVTGLPSVKFGRTRYSYDLEEAAIMKELYHTLRFRMYADAIDGMNRLVNLYIAESRYSEAKWYLLQCNYFGRKSNNTQAVISSLVSLGMLKADIGEYDQAKQDLLDARDLCTTQNMAAQVTEIDKKLKVVEVKRFANVKNDVQYAEVFEIKKG